MTSLAETVTPGTVAEAAEAMTEAAARKATVACVGGGTELGYGYPGPGADVILRTGRLARVVEYAPADMVVEVEAGMTLAALGGALAPHGQRLAIDPPHPELATLGGLVATNAFGPRRARFGGFRDLIVGVSLIRADGTRVRGGGKVVKNVAGFDLPKLAVGSLGSLGMIATMTFRLHPIPESARAVHTHEAGGVELRSLAKDIVARQLEPSLLFAERTSAGYDAYAVFEGFAAGVAEQVERYAALARERGTPADEGDGPARAAERDERVRTYGDVRMRFSVPPASLDALDRDALQPLAHALGDARIVAYPVLGAAFVSAYVANADAAAAALNAARAVAERLGGNAVLVDVRDPALAKRVDVYGTLPPSFALMVRLKDRFDPARRLNPGRFLGGL